MPHERLRFALERLGTGEWQLFERFASEFLVPDFPSIRTTATPSGDKGRDGELFEADGVTTTGFQYSVTQNWKAKIRSTLTTLEGNGLHYRRIIYCTSQEIGASGDELKAEFFDSRGIVLDIRDREWFCERESSSPERILATAELTARIVDPIVTARGIATAAGAPLDGIDAKVALVQLALNANDRQGDRNLTKTSFDAIVQSALLDTKSETAISEDDVVARVSSLVPSGAANQVRELVKSALVRLTRKHGPVKHVVATGRYHLSFDAFESWKEQAAGYLLDQEALENDLFAAAYGYLDELDSDESALRGEAAALRAALEAIMMRSGESFVTAMEGADAGHLSVETIAEQLRPEVARIRLRPQDAAAAIIDVLSGPSDRTQRHLTRVLDAYTLLSFLQQTPDVQKSLSRIFDNARIWLDTSAILPLIAETLIEDEGSRAQTDLLRAARDSGVALYVTDGVIEEIRFHIERCVAYITRTSRWEGGLPFLYTAYMLSGRDEKDFSDWAHAIRGPVDPEQDIADYLLDIFGIEPKDLREVAEQADLELRAAAQELFRNNRSGDRRRTENVIDRLVQHDTENAVGVIQLRKGARPALGHEVWWLTLDRAAFRLHSWLKDQMGQDAPDTPVLSPDYLSQLLRLGPLRRSVGEQAERLPLVVDVTRMESAPIELIEEARKIRASMQGLDERLIRREVRDGVQRFRTAMRASHNYQDEMVTGVTQALIRNKGARPARGIVAR